MSWRIVAITSRAKLDYKMNYLVVRTSEETKRININEISVLIIESTGVSLTAYLLSELIKSKVYVLFCDEKRLPQCELLPLYGCFDTSLKVRNTELILSDDKILSIEKYVDLILSPFSLELNSKKILNKLNDYLGKNLDNYEEQFNKLAYSINKFGSELTMLSQYSIIYSEIQNVHQIIKALDFKIDDDLPVNERIIEYMRLNRDLLGKKLFVFVGLKSYFSDDDVRLFYKDIMSEKFDVLLLEGHQCPYRVDVEKVRIIDSDLCE